MNKELRWNLFKEDTGEPKVGNYMKDDDGSYHEILKITADGKGVKFMHTKSFKVPFTKGFQDKHYTCSDK